MNETCFRCGSAITPGGAVTDAAGRGVCPRCREALLCQSGVGLQGYLDSLPEPVLLVDGDGRIQAVNEKARNLLHRDLLNFRGEAFGVAFECRYARLPGGCGRTVHCSGCTIRQAVTETYQTGETVLERGATLQPAGLDEKPEVRMLISTKKLGDAVLLKISMVS